MEDIEVIQKNFGNDGANEKEFSNEKYGQQITDSKVNKPETY